jgi:hypothetical protein
VSDPCTLLGLTLNKLHRNGELSGCGRGASRNQMKPGIVRRAAAVHIEHSESGILGETGIKTNLGMITRYSVLNTCSPLKVQAGASSAQTQFASRIVCNLPAMVTCGF